MGAETERRAERAERSERKERERACAKGKGAFTSSRWVWGDALAGDTRDRCLGIGGALSFLGKWASKGPRLGDYGKHTFKVVLSPGWRDQGSVFGASESLLSRAGVATAVTRTFSDPGRG